MSAISDGKIDSHELWRDDPEAEVSHAVSVGRSFCSCDYPYHVIWPILRAAGMTGSLRYDEDTTLAQILKPFVSSNARL